VATEIVFSYGDDSPCTNLALICGLIGSLVPGRELSSLPKRMIVTRVGRPTQRNAIWQPAHRPVRGPSERTPAERRHFRRSVNGGSIGRISGCSTLFPSARAVMAVPPVGRAKMLLFPCPQCGAERTSLTAECRSCGWSPTSEPTVATACDGPAQTCVLGRCCCRCWRRRGWCS